MTDASLAGYSRARSITHDHTKVGAADLSDFPLLIYFNADATVGANIDSAGHGLRLAPNYDTLAAILYHERNGSASLASGQLTELAFVKTTTLSKTTDTVIYVLFANNSTDGSDSAGNAWESRYKGRWGMEQDPSGSAPQITDSTSNANHLTSAGSMTSGALVSGQVGSGLNFVQSSNQYLTISDNASLSGGSNGMAFEGIFSLASKTAPLTLTVLAGKHDASTKAEWLLHYDATADRFTYNTYSTGGTLIASVVATSFGSPSTGIKYHIACGYDAGNSQVWIQVNGGTRDTASASTAIQNSTAAFRIAALDSSPVYAYDGFVDECRFVNGSTQTADFETCNYHNQFDAGNNLTFGSGFRFANLAASDSSGDKVASASYQFNHVIQTYAESLYTAVAVHILSVPGASVTSVTALKGGVDTNLAFIVSEPVAGGTGSVEWWGLAGTDTGTNVIKVVISTAVESVATVFTNCGIHQTSPIGVTAVTNGTLSSGDPSLSLTTGTNGSLVMSAIAVNDTSIDAAGSYRDKKITAGTLGAAGASMYGIKSTAGSVSTSFTNVAATSVYAIAAFELRDVNAAALTGSFSDLINGGLVDCGLVNGGLAG